MIPTASLRFAHTEGFISLCSDSYGNIITCGADGDARLWKDFETDDPVSYRVGEAATAICAFKNIVYVSDESGFIHSIEIPGGTDRDTVCKFSLPVNHMDISVDGRYILACSSDFSLKLIAITSNNSLTTIGLDDHIGHPYASVSLDPKTEYVAGSSCDGSVKIYSVSSPSKAVEVINVLPKLNDISVNRPLARLQFKPIDGELLAVPTGQKVYLYQRHTWIPIRTLSVEDNDNREFSVCRFSDCGKYLAAGSLRGHIIVWEVESGKVLKAHQHPKSTSICALLWHPVHKGRLIFGDVSGSVGVLDDILPHDEQSADVELASAAASRHSFDDDEVSCDSNIGALKAHYNSKIYGSDEDDDSAFKKYANKTVASTLPPAVTTFEPSWKPKPPQKPFIVNSTPEHLTERYMKWNEIAIIRQYNDGEESSIEVEFHDVSVHHAIQLNNAMSQYTMADVSTQSVVFCSPGNDTKPGRLHAIHFGAWDLSKEWTAEMPANETPCCLALANDWLAVSSLSRNVWLFTVSGFLYNTFILPAPPIAMAAGHHKLIIAYNDGFDVDGFPLYCCVLIENVMPSKDGPTMSTQRLPISPGSRLVWLGFSEKLLPCACDSNGLLIVFRQSQWMPIFNAVLPNSDFFWPISVQDSSSFKVRGIRCLKAASSNNKYPLLLPRPIMTFLDCKLNLCDSQTDKTEWECKFILNTLPTLDSENDEQMEKERFQAILKLFIIACNDERDCRAYDIARLVDNCSTLNTLINISHKKGRRVLAEKISTLASIRLNEEHENSARLNFINNVSTDNGTFVTHPNILSKNSLSGGNAKRTQSPPVTQPLFTNNTEEEEDDDYKNFAEDDDSVAVENTSVLTLKKHTDVKCSPMSSFSNGRSVNPFKKNTSLDSPSLDNESSFGKSVFDNIDLNSNKKRTSKNENDIGALTAEVKKPKMMTLKKQAKLSFGSKLADFKSDV